MVRRPKQADPFRLEQGLVTGQLPGIGIEILVRAELARIDEDRDNDVGCALPRFAHQGQVAFVQGAHRWHQGQRPVDAQGVERVAQWIKPGNGLHGRIPLGRRHRCRPSAVTHSGATIQASLT